MEGETIGSRFGRLVIEAAAPSNVHRKRRWQVLCDCGRRATVVARHLRSGRTASCGCLRSEMVAAKNYRHGMRRIPEYTIWLAMRARCNDPKHKGFKDYGERGIKVCSEWDSFDAFYRHVGPRPTPEHSIDRIDNNRGYEPGNCRWSTSKQQASNRRPRKAANVIR